MNRLPLLTNMRGKKDEDDGWQQPPPTRGYDWFPWKRPVVNG
jgi:hypothetical protein